MVVILCERLAVQHSPGWVIRSMDHKLGIYLASPTRRCVSFLLELYVNLLGLSFNSHQFINNLPPSVGLPPLSVRYVYLCGAVIHPLAPKGGVRVGLEPTIPRLQGTDLDFLCIKRVLGGRSVDPTRPWIPCLRTDTVLCEWAPWFKVQSFCTSRAES